MSNELKPKIKLTKALPGEVGQYYYYDLEGDFAEIFDVDFIDGKLTINRDGMFESLEARAGGYWAEVEQDHFEVEGE